MINHYHHVTFEVVDYYGNSKAKYNTLFDWGLYLSAPATISPPELQTISLEVPGRNGLLDLTEAATGYPVYGNREIEFELLCIDKKRKWRSIYHNVQNAIHGKRCKIICSDDPEYYYIGRVTVEEWGEDDKIAKPVISAEVEPFKMEVSPRKYHLDVTADGNRTTIDITQPNVSTEEWNVDMVWGGPDIVVYDWNSWTTYPDPHVTFETYPNPATSCEVTIYRVDGTSMTYTYTKSPNVVESKTVVIPSSTLATLANWYRITITNARSASVTVLILGAHPLHLDGSEKPVSPIISSSKEITMVAGSRFWTVPAGSWSDPQLQIRKDGMTLAVFNTSPGASVDVQVRGGFL